VLFVIMVLLAIFSTGVAMLLASANVYFTDITYLWAIVAQLLFYATPVIWDPETVGNKTLTNIASLGPTGAFVMAIHQVLYDLQMPSLARFAQLTVYALVSVGIGAWGFSRLSPKFAEIL
jgi:ABC-type polysaccharide/polyol phosphate export permease